MAILASAFSKLECGCFELALKIEWFEYATLKENAQK